MQVHISLYVGVLIVPYKLCWCAVTTLIVAKKLRTDMILSSRESIAIISSKIYLQTIFCVQLYILAIFIDV
jgi:hypothetical protein